MSSDTFACTQCGGKGCAWCFFTGSISEDRLREVQEENRKADDDRDWARERDRRSGAHFG